MAILPVFVGSGPIWPPGRQCSVDEFTPDAKTTRTPDGCLLTPTREPRKVRFRGRQILAYRFVYAVLNREVLSWNDVVRHRCHRRRCINPRHLERGDRRDNKHDDWDYWANGLDRALIYPRGEARDGQKPAHPAHP